MLRAPQRGPRPEYTDTIQDVPGHWEPSRWWRVVAEERLLAESSNPEDEAFREALASPGATLERQFVFVPAIVQWRTIEETP